MKTYTIREMKEVLLNNYSNIYLPERAIPVMDFLSWLEKQEESKGECEHVYDEPRCCIKCSYVKKEKDITPELKMLDLDYSENIYITRVNNMLIQNTINNIIRFINKK